MTLIALQQVSESLLEQINLLLPQLSSSAAPMTLGELSAIVNREGTTLFVAQDGDVVLGMLTLVTFKIPTGTRAWIEDVVLDVVSTETILRSLKWCKMKIFDTRLGLIIITLPFFSIFKFFISTIVCSASSKPISLKEAVIVPVTLSSTTIFKL